MAVLVLTPFVITHLSNGKLQADKRGEVLTPFVITHLSNLQTIKQKREEF